jgi:hypothetical protein
MDLRAPPRHMELRAPPRHREFGAPARQLTSSPARIYAPPHFSRVPIY